MKFKHRWSKGSDYSELNLFKFYLRANYILPLCSVTLGHQVSIVQLLLSDSGTDIGVLGPLPWSH